MAEHGRSWVARWRDALRPDANLAEAEGLAAGTGLLTGTIARTVGRDRSNSELTCPSCGGKSEIVVVDLVVAATTLRCGNCARRWTIQN